MGLGWLQKAGDFFAGGGDAITFGGTAWIRGQINNAFGLPNSVDYCSSWYQRGEFAGVGTSLLVGGYGLLGDAAEGGSLLERLRAIDLADETGSLGDEPSVKDILQGKLGSIRRAPLPPGSPSWEDVSDMTMSEIRAAARANQPGYKTILKLLTDSRFDRSP